MGDRRRLLAPALLLVSAILAAGPQLLAPAEPAALSVGGARYRLDAVTAERAGARRLPADVRADGLRFDPSVAALDRQAVADAVAGSRPDARRLVDLVDGLVTVRVGGTGAGAVGMTQETAEGYVVTLDLAEVSTANGPRGVTRLVLHELAHVVDSAIVPDDVMATLDAGIPPGWECGQGTSGACATVEERFAESFAKWATGDIGVDLYIGYRVPPPGPTLDAWGQPLARLAA